MADRVEHAEHAMSALMRFVVSLIIPLWALAMVALGVEYRSLWWLGCGLVVGAIGLILGSATRWRVRCSTCAKVGGPCRGPNRPALTKTKIPPEGCESHASGLICERSAGRIFFRSDAYFRV